MKYFKGVPLSMNNVVSSESKEENYYVSYNSSHRGYDIDTTALVITIGNNERQVFYILEGNHSSMYAGCKNLRECISYLMENKELIHGNSDEFEHEHLLNEE